MPTIAEQRAALEAALAKIVRLDHQTRFLPLTRKCLDTQTLPADTSLIVEEVEKQVRLQRKAHRHHEAAEVEQRLYLFKLNPTITALERIWSR